MTKQKSTQGKIHIYFTNDEYMTMKGNMIIFEDGVKIFADEWLRNKDYLLDGWSFYLK